MTDAEVEEVLRDINDEVRWILENQRRLAEIERQLELRDLNPLEEDYIDADLMNDEVGGERRRVLNGVEIRIRKLHRRGARSTDIFGADLLYEIAGQKYALIQYKTANRRGRVLNDKRQLDQLMGACAHPCPPRPNSLRGCGAWHAVRNGPGHYHPACVASEFFERYISRGEKVFAGGISKRDFDWFFARCDIGAPLRREGLDHLAQARVDAGRLVIWATQTGRF